MHQFGPEHRNDGLGQRLPVVALARAMRHRGSDGSNTSLDDHCLVAGISCWLQNISPEVLQRLLETIMSWLRWKRREDTEPLRLPLAAMPMIPVPGLRVRKQINKRTLPTFNTLLERKKIPSLDPSAFLTLS